MRGAHDFSIDIVWVARKWEKFFWCVWQNMLRDKVLSVRVQQTKLFVGPNTVLHSKTASAGGTRRRYEVTAWFGVTVISTARMAWIVCQKKILWLTIEIGAILRWNWHVPVARGGLCPTIHSSRCRNLEMNEIGWRKIWGKVYCVLRSHDIQTWRCEWFRHDSLRGLDARVTASLSIYRQIRGTWPWLTTSCHR